MGKSKNKSRSEVEFLRGQVRQLKAELKYFKRRDHISNDIIDTAIGEQEVENVDATRCVSCKSGLLLEYDFNFVILKKCENCGYSEKQKKKPKKNEE